MKAKRKQVYWRCICDKGFAKGELGIAISHFRKEHPEEAYRCWDSYGDIGDPFAAKVIEHIQSLSSEQGKQLREAQNKLKYYQTLIPRFNAMSAALNISEEAISSLRAFEKVVAEEKK